MTHKRIYLITQNRGVIKVMLNDTYESLHVQNSSEYLFCWHVHILNSTVQYTVLLYRVNECPCQPWDPSDRTSVSHLKALWSCDLLYGSVAYLLLLGAPALTTIAAGNRLSARAALLQLETRRHDTELRGETHTHTHEAARGCARMKRGRERKRITI